MRRRATIALALGLLSVFASLAEEPAAPIQVPSRRDGVVLKVLVAEGEKVQAGSLLARIDDRLAAADRDLREARLVAASADYEAAVRTRDQAAKHADGVMRLRSKGEVSEDELRKVVEVKDRLSAEAAVKAEAINLAKLELKQAELVLSTCQIRAPANGIVRKILKEPGEAVRNLETVFHLDVSGR